MQDVFWYEWLYQINIDWNICNTKTQIPLRKHIMHWYERVFLVKDKKKTNHSVHRLVATNFIRLPNKWEVVNHKDWNKLNNNVDNLEWCTSSENQIHSVKVLGAKHWKRKAISFSDIDKNIIWIFDSIRDASREFNICASWIHRSINKWILYKNYFWSYKDQWCL